MNFIEMCKDMSNYQNKLILCPIKSDIQILYTKLYYYEFDIQQNIDIYDKTYNAAYNPQVFDEKAKHNIIITNYKHDTLLCTSDVIYNYNEFSNDFDALESSFPTKFKNVSK